MSRHNETMTYAIGMATDRIVNALMQYVMAVGNDFTETDYYRNEFGIDDDEEEGVSVLKVLDIFNNGGCYFPYTDLCQVDEEGKNDIYWYSYAFHCLYVIERDGIRYLKYYMLWNNGKEYNSDESEPDHGYVDMLSLQVLDKLVSFIGQYDQHIK